MMRTRKNIAGFTMVEILVAIIVMTVGLLGMGAMQVMALKANRSSSYRSQATLLANDMVERMRANRRSVFAAAPATPIYADPAIVSYAPDCAAALPNPYCSDRPGIPGAACSRTQMAAFDAYAWICGDDTGGAGRIGGVNATLPEGTGAVSVNAMDPTRLDVTLNWEEVNPDWVQGDPDADRVISQSLVLSVVP